MCGIAGKIHFDRERPVNPRQIRAMTDSLRHRGPDDDGVWTSRNVGLGHRRLAIIDLSPDGRNPMPNEDETIWIVFNGEIYNFQELRPQLEAAGHRFRSRTDTEVILHLYEELGALCVQRLRGMFAFAIWDGRQRRLLLARDRLGVKPLHYAVTPTGLLFGSEIKALLASGEIDPAPDLAGLHQFLMWQCVPAPRTAFQGVRKLPPASILTWQRGRELTIETYWRSDWGSDAPPAKSAATAKAASSKRDEAALAERTRDMVEEATRLRLVADVPVGVFLSGGIDSACVLAAARRAHAGRLQTFSVSFGDRRLDESAHARLLAERFDTEHHEFQVTHSVLEMLPRMAALFDEPFADVAAIPTYYLSKLTGEHVKVALSGDGGDEAFGGYQRFLALKVLGWLGHVPGIGALQQLRRWLPYAAGERSRWRYLRELLALAGREPAAQYRAMLLGMVEEEEWMACYSDDFRAAIAPGDDPGTFIAGWQREGREDAAEEDPAEQEAPEQAASAYDQTATPSGAPPFESDGLARATLSDLLGYLPECINVKVDRASMACGLEVRSPFLDHKLIEFSARLPSALKIRGLQQKHILKRAFEKELPPEVLRRGKAGFSLPLAAWLRGELRPLAEEMLLSADSSRGGTSSRTSNGTSSGGLAVGGLFKRETIQAMFEQHAAGKRNWHVQIWRLLVLENWLRTNASRARPWPREDASIPELGRAVGGS